jgi:hypothetical protein
MGPSKGGCIGVAASNQQLLGVKMRNTDSRRINGLGLTLRPLWNRGAGLERPGRPIGLPSVSVLTCALAVGALAALPKASVSWADESPQINSDRNHSLQVLPDPTGAIATVNVNGPTDTRGAFFQSLGTNGRTGS